MKLMKLSTNKILNKHFILQSLPLAVAAIALVLYLYTFLPLSVKRMEGSVALVERTYYMQLCINGKPIAYFNALNDSMLPVSLTHDLARLTPNRQYLNGCWINRWPLLPSCHGTLLTVLPDDGEGTSGEDFLTGDDERINPKSGNNRANGNSKNPADGKNKELTDEEVESPTAAKTKAPKGENEDTISRIIRQLEKSIGQQKRTNDELQYYLLVHNVNDEGFHTMAAYAEQMKLQLAEQERLYNALTQVADQRSISISTVSTYRILLPQQPDSAIACTPLPVKEQAFIVLQTADKTTPQGACPLYLHQWLTPAPGKDRAIIAASFAGTMLYNRHPVPSAVDTQEAQGMQDDSTKQPTSAMQPRSGLFQGKIIKDRQHDIPALLAADAAPVFTADGRFIGINYRHHIITPDRFGWRLQHLLP